MKILIIGSEGFIGSHLKNYFEKDNDIWGADIIVKNSNRNYFNLNENLDFEMIFKNHKFDVCINASGNGSVPISIINPLFDFKLNTYNTIKILESIRLQNFECKFINLSSAAVYGNPKTLPIQELSELNPLSPYGWHKLYAENLCKEYYYLYGVNTINLRLFSVYGNGLKKQLFWDIYQKSLQNKKVRLFGSGNETRDFIFIDDLMVAIELIVKKANFIGESINIASGFETTINRAATIFLKEIDDSLELEFNQEVKKGDPLNWKPSIDILKSFGFNQRVNIEEGLKKTAKWMKEIS